MISVELTALAGVGRQHYRVTYRGAVLVERSRDPEFAACRALMAMRITGTLQTYRRGFLAPAMRMDIERGAKLSVETDAVGGLADGLHFPWLRSLGRPRDPCNLDDMDRQTAHSPAGDRRL
jgi:hypothetical protein